jgi:hypothetical protein
MKYFLLPVFLLLSLFAAAQSNFKKGYVITTSGDTLKGLIDYKEREINPQSFRFKNQASADTKIFDKKSILACEIDNIDSYVAFPVNITTSSVEISNLSSGPDLRFRTDTVFLKVLQSGKNITLYAYKDQVKMRFYVREQHTDVPLELIRQMYIREDGVLATGDAYIRQLRSYLQKYNEGESTKISGKLKYNQTELTHIAALINHQEIIKSQYNPVRFFAGIGLTSSQAKYKGNNILANSSATSKTSYLPSISAGIDFFANPAIGRLIYRADLSLLMSKSEIAAVSGNQAIAAVSQQFDQLIVAFTPQVIYNFYNADKLKAFIGAGLALNISAYSNNVFKRYNSFRDDTEVLENETKLESFYFSIPISAGIVLNKKVQLTVSYSPPAAISNYIDYSIAVQRSHIGVAYLFGKK